MDTNTAAVEYVAAGWSLCAIPLGQKGPTTKGWNERGNAIRTAAQAERLTGNVGLCHAWSGTCAVDVDRLDDAREYLAGQGIDLDALLAAEDAVMITSGRAGRAKLLYRTLVVLPSRKLANGALELRCGSSNGLTVQDVLPPSIHPETGLPYEWAYGDELTGDWRILPELPAALLALWQNAPGSAPAASRADEGDPLLVDPPLGLSLDELEKLVYELDPDMPYDSDDLEAGSWLRVGMAIHHETGGSPQGFALWAGWSGTGGKFKGLDDMRPHWASFDKSKSQQITARWLRKLVKVATHDKTAPILSTADWMANAREHLEREFTGEHGSTLLRHNGAWFRHTGPCYAEVNPEAMRATVWHFQDKAEKWSKPAKKDEEPELIPYLPQPKTVSNQLDALTSLVQCEAEQTPCWLSGTGPAPADLIAMANGLLHAPDLRLMAHTPRYFNLNALPFDWQPDAPAPEQWLDFLTDLWRDDPASVDTLQEVFGYLLSADTRQQKIFLLIGPKRSGKGTIGRILSALLGAANVVGPTLGSMAGQFGLEPLVGKMACIVPDARLSARVDANAIVEKLLMISGEDTITVDRKNRTSWTGRLPCRIVVLTNEIPRFADASGALAGRLIVLEMKRSWYGKEDLGLEQRLMGELPGILKWALAGRERLLARGYFDQPASAAEVIEELASLTSPVSAFVKECCVLDRGATAPCHDLYNAWRDWCSLGGRDHPGTIQAFGRDLRAAFSDLTRCQVGGRDGRTWAYKGLRLRDDLLDLGA